MKKILFILLLIPFAASSQNLDTVTVNGLTLKADVWLVFVGKNASSTDSLTERNIRIIRNAIQPQLPIPWTTDVTISGLSGKKVVEFYEQFLQMSYGTINIRGTEIRNAFRAKLNILSWLDALEAQAPNEFIRWRNLGKPRTLDQ